MSWAGGYTCWSGTLRSLWGLWSSKSVDRRGCRTAVYLRKRLLEAKITCFKVFLWWWRRKTQLSEVIHGIAAVVKDDISRIELSWKKRDIAFVYGIWSTGSLNDFERHVKAILLVVEDVCLYLKVLRGKVTGRLIKFHILWSLDQKYLAQGR